MLQGNDDFAAGQSRLALNSLVNWPIEATSDVTGRVFARTENTLTNCFICILSGFESYRAQLCCEHPGCHPREFGVNAHLLMHTF